MLNRLRVLFFIWIICVLFSCHEDRVRQIPISDFFKNAERSFFRLSPDGKYVSYLKPYKGRQNLFIQSLTDGKEQMVTSFADFSISNYSWTYDNKIVLRQDSSALDEVKMFALDVPTLQLREVLSLKKRIRCLGGKPNKQ